MKQFDKVMTIDRDMWLKEIAMHDELFFKLYDRLPKEMTFIRELLVSNRIGAPPAKRWKRREEKIKGYIKLDPSRLFV